MAKTTTKWITTKEYLLFADVVEIYNSAVASGSFSPLIAYFSKYLSTAYDVKFTYQCTFTSTCQLQCSAHKIEERAKDPMKTHIKQHIEQLLSATEVQQEEFATKNQLYNPKTGKATAKAKQTSPKTSKAKGKTKLEVSKNQAKPDSPMARKGTTKGMSPKGKPKNGVGAQTQKTSSSGQRSENEPISENAVQAPGDSPQAAHTPGQSPNERSSGSTDVQAPSDIDSSQASDASSSVTVPKKELEGTVQYRIAMKMFTINRRDWTNVEPCVDRKIEMMDTDNEVTEEDRQKLIATTYQYILSAKVCDIRKKESYDEPLTPEEEEVIDSLAEDGWKKLKSSKDLKDKQKLQASLKLLLRKIKSRPRGSEPITTCEHCSFHYTASTSVSSHLTSQSGLRYWICTKCTEAKGVDVDFTRKNSLAYHIIAENNIPRFVCNIYGCNKRHNHKHHQKVHAMMHRGEKAYTCETCNKKIACRNTYGRHLLEAHDIELLSNNKLNQLQPEEALQKRQVGREKANMRSKRKRQQTGDEDSSSSAEKNDASLPPKKRRAARAAPECEDKSQAVNKKGTTEEISGDNVQPRPMDTSASQLLSGIVEKVSHSQEERVSKSPPSGNLDLLVAVTMQEYTRMKKEEESKMAPESSSLSDSFTAVKHQKENSQGADHSGLSLEICNQNTIKVAVHHEGAQIPHNELPVQNATHVLPKSDKYSNCADQKSAHSGASKVPFARQDANAQFAHHSGFSFQASPNSGYIPVMMDQAARPIDASYNGPTLAGQPLRSQVFLPPAYLQMGGGESVVVFSSHSPSSQQVIHVPGTKYTTRYVSN